MTDYVSSNFKNLSEMCHRPFRYWELQKNFKGHLYASIQATQARLNNLGVPWDLTHNSLVVERYQALNKKNETVTNYDAFCSVQLHIEGLGTRMGTGADTNQDCDTATKSALAYALRKAGNQFGIAWYITNKPAEEVALWSFLIDADLTDLDDLKEVVRMCAKIDDKTPVEWLGERVGTETIIYDEAKLTEILRVEGRI